MRLGGRAVFEYDTGNLASRVSDVSSFNATGRVSVDTRTATDFGLLRTFTRHGNSPHCFKSATPGEKRRRHPR